MVAGPDTEARLRALFDELRNLLQTPGLSPCVAGNLRVALAAVWQVTNDLGLAFDQVYDLGV